MPTVEKMKPIHVFVPFTRVSESDEERTVEGWAFTQEVVKGEGGKRLKRSAMEKATPDYLLNGTIRAMHQPIAAGKPLLVDWHQKGAFVRGYIGDDQEWHKVKTGIYKGFSIGVNALEMRGLDVEECHWFDCSLVDIGKDTGAKFTAWRGEGEEEVDCEILPADPVLYVRSEELPTLDGMLLTDAIDLLRTVTSTEAPSRENLEGSKGVVHYPCNSEYGCHGHTTKDGAQECKDKDEKDKDAQANWHKEQLGKLKAKRVAEGRESDPPDEDAPTEHITRIAALETEAALLLTRAVSAESDLAIERAALSAAKETISRLEKEPLPGQTPPVRYAGQYEAAERKFAANDAEKPDTANVAAELQRMKIECTAEPDQRKREEIIARMMRISQVSGVPIP